MSDHEYDQQPGLVGCIETIVRDEIVHVVVEAEHIAGDLRRVLDTLLAAGHGGRPIALGERVFLSVLDAIRTLF